MSDPRSSGILRGLRSRNPRKAWAAFLEAYSPVILDVIRLFERDEDAAGNCYLFVCERLCRDRFRRLGRLLGGGRPRAFMGAALRAQGEDDGRHQQAA